MAEKLDLCDRLLNDLLRCSVLRLSHKIALLACCKGSKHVFMSFSDTKSVFLDVALLLDTLQGSP